MTTPDWPAFLTARLDELEADADGKTPFNTPQVRNYLLADIAAKRAILKRYREREDAFVSRTSLTEPDQRIEGMLGMRLNGHLEDIKDLCRPFADHDDWPGE